MGKIEEGVILRYLRGESTQEDFRIMNEWMDISPDNKRFLFTVEELLARSKWKGDEEQTVEAAMKRLKSAIDKEDGGTIPVYTLDNNEKKPIIKTVYHFWRYAAAVVLLVFIGSLSYMWLTRENQINVYADNKIKKVELPDGTKVWLNKGTMLSYSDKFNSDNRKVYLNGEAYFEVTKQPGKKLFIVESKMMNVIVKGTIFNMNSYSDGSTAETSLIEGEVIVESSDKDSRIMLLPGQKAVYDNSRERLTVKETNANMDGVWRNDMLPFQNSSIKDITDVLRKMYNVDIQLSDDIDLNTTYSGMIKKKDKLEDVMKALKNSIPIEYEIKNNLIILKPRK